MKIYALGGLGADERVFAALKLKAPIHVLDWIAPKAHESLEDYAYRLSDQIDFHDECILLGVSFGGMLAVALQKHVQPQLTILISSAQNKYALPWIYRWFGKTQLLRIIPYSWLRLPNWLAVWLFGAEHKALLIDIMRKTDLQFLKWALMAIANWSEDKEHENIVSIHGTKDKLIPFHSNAHRIAIQNAGHFMIVDRADELSSIMNRKIKSLL